MAKEFSDMYWCPDKLLSRNKLFNFVIGNRGGGKSFGAKRLAINRFLKTGQQFVYVRRYKNEFDLIKTYFTDIAEFYEGHTFNVKAGEFLVDDKVAGYYIPLSLSSRYKSSSYPKVWLIIFDEFIIDKGRVSYIKNEVPVFLDLYETVARTRDVISLFISNAISSFNPYFLYFNIRLKEGAKFTTLEECCIERYKGTEFTQMKRKTRFGKLIEGSKYGDYAIENDFYRDNNEFINKMSEDAIPYVKIKFMDRIYCVWRGIRSGYMFFNKKTPPETVLTYCVTTEDHRPDYLYIRSIRNNSWFKELLYAYDIGVLRFDSIESKEVFYDIMSLV